MPDSVVAAFSRPEDFEAALRADGYLTFLVAAPGCFRARLTQVSIKEMRLLSGEEQLPRVGFVSAPDKMILIFFTGGNFTAPIYSGVRMRADELVMLRPGEGFHARTDGVSRWNMVRLPAEDLSKYGAALIGPSFRPLSVTQRWRPTRSAIRRLRSLHAAVIRTAASQPHAIVDAEAAHGLEQQILHTIVDCVSHGLAVGPLNGERLEQAIMYSFEQLMQDQQVGSLSIAEICSKLKVSELSLRRWCAKHVGMNPSAYDRLRRMALQ